MLRWFADSVEILQSTRSSFYMRLKHEGRELVGVRVCGNACLHRRWRACVWERAAFVKERAGSTAHCVTVLIVYNEKHDSKRNVSKWENAD